MNSILKNAILKSFHGEWTHIDPKRALEGLSINVAKEKPKGFDHSCWDLLHHVLIWQQALINNIKGQDVDWREIEEKENWPSKDEIKNDETFTHLLKTFFSNLEHSKELIKSVELFNEKEISVGPTQLTRIKLILVLLQHTSYHLGQIVSLRKYLGDWPENRNES